MLTPKSLIVLLAAAVAVPAVLACGLDPRRSADAPACPARQPTTDIVDCDGPPIPPKPTIPEPKLDCDGPPIPPQTAGLLDFDEARVINACGRQILIVKGEVAEDGVTASLVPVTYVRQPEHWLIEVAAVRAGPTRPGRTKFSASLDVTETLGTQGILVRGSTKSQQIDVKP